MTKPFILQVKETRIQEIMVSKILAEHFKCVVTMTESHNQFYDGSIELDKGAVTYELKDDRNKCRTTGNHFLEIESRGKDTGIMITKADYWIVHPDNNCLLMIPTPTIRRGILDNKWTQVAGGDYVNGKPTSIGILIPISWIESNKLTKTIKIDKKYNEKR